MSDNSYLNIFSAQVWKIVFLAYLTVLRLITIVRPETSKTHIFAISVQSITNRFFSLFDRFKAYYNYMTWNVRKLLTPRFQCTSITTRFLTFLTGLRLITTVWPEMAENSYLC